MGDESSEYKIRIATTADTAGAERTAAALDQIGNATAMAGERAAALSAQQQEAAQIAQLYGVKIGIAEQALAILGAETGKATANMVELDAAMDLAQAQAQQAAAANAAYTAQLQSTAAAAIAAGQAQEKLGVISDGLSAALTRLSISETEVAAAATRFGLSMEVAGRALVQMKMGALADEVTAARVAMEEATVATAAQTTAQEAETVATVESTVATKADTEALAQRAIMMRRTSDGLVDLAMGGRRAVQGVADLQYVLTSLIPEGAAVIGVLGGIALIGELWEHITQKMAKDHEKAVDKIKAQNDLLAHSADGMLASLNAALEAQAQLATADTLSLANDRERNTLSQKDLTIAKEISEERLRASYLDAESKATTPQQREFLHKQYEADKEEIEGQSSVATAQAVLRAKGDEITGTRKELEDTKKSQSDNISQLGSARDQAATAQNLLNSLGIAAFSDGTFKQTVTETGLNGHPYQTTQDPIAPMQQKVQELIAQLQNAKDAQKAWSVEVDGYGQKGALPGESEADRKARVAATPGRLQSQVDTDQKALEDQQGLLSDIQSAPTRIKEGNEEQSKLAPKIKEQSAKIADIQTRIGVLDTESEQLVQELDIAKTKAAQDAEQAKVDKALREREAAQDAAKAEFGHREAARYVQEEAQQKIIDNPTSTPDQKARAKAEQDRLKAQADRDKIATGSAMGLSNDEITRAGGKLDVDQAKPGFVIMAQNQKDQKLAVTAEHKELQGAVEEAARALEASGNKPLIESFRKLAAGADLQQKGAILLAELATASVAQHDLIEQRLQRAENAIYSLTNRH